MHDSLLKDVFISHAWHLQVYKYKHELGLDKIWIQALILLRRVYITNKLKCRSSFLKVFVFYSYRIFWRIPKNLLISFYDKNSDIEHHNLWIKKFKAFKVGILLLSLLYWQISSMV